MKPLLSIAAMLFREERLSFFIGLVLAMTVLAMGVALLGLSGWFITAAAAAGMAGVGASFNVFMPSAMVRLLALGRTAARYGERLTSHDATLRTLSGLRIRLLTGLLQAPFRRLESLRTNSFLNRVTADVDALDGVALRLLLPGISGLAIIGLAGIFTALLVAPSVGLIVVIGYGVLPSGVFVLGQRRAARPARRREMGMQALRSRLIDLVNVREDLFAFGQMIGARDNALAAMQYQAETQQDVERVERRIGFLLELTGWGIVALALGRGAGLASAGSITPAQAAIGVFVSLALSETVVPVRRALSEIGAMRSAAKRILPMLKSSAKSVSAPTIIKDDSVLRADEISFRRSATSQTLFKPLSFSVAPGAVLALTGRSGCGKSTVLLMAAGQIEPSAGQMTYGGVSPYHTAPHELMRRVAMLPQRHAMVAGTIAENLRLSAPEATDEQLWEALEVAALTKTISEKGGLESRLGFRGTGLSGGETRRLALARALLRKPKLLLLDEPTEGMDSEAALLVLERVRLALPETAILMAAHRPEEVNFADRVVPVVPCADN